MSSKENVHSVVDSPRFDPWTTEEWFDDKGRLHSQELYLTPVRLKRGSMGPFIERFRQYAATNKPFYFEFYSPAGLLMTAEVRSLTVPDEQEMTYDTVNFLVALSPEQVLAIFLDEYEVEDFGY